MARRLRTALHFAATFAYATSDCGAGSWPPGLPTAVSFVGEGLWLGNAILPLPPSLTLNGTFPNRLFGDVSEWPRTSSPTVGPLCVGVSEVTNAQYERFDPSHAAMRGKWGFSTGDNEAVVFVTFADAVAYTAWASSVLNRTVRLPTEAEAEAIIRANTSTYFNTGNAFPDGVRCDTHGNVEEWTSDVFTAYPGSGSVPSVRSGITVPPSTFRVTRGGSHSSDVYFLRSAARAGAIPGDASWYIGFRVVVEEQPGNRHADWAASLGPLGPRWSEVFAPATARPRSHVHAQRQLDEYRAVRRTTPLHQSAIKRVASSTRLSPVFQSPLRYVHTETPEAMPFVTHNHDPALVACPSGDLLAVWFSTITESGRESGLVSSWLLQSSNATAWTPAQPWWKTPGRMDNAPLLLLDPVTQVLFSFHGMSASATWGSNALVMRTSTDCGQTWSAQPSIIAPEHYLHHQPTNAGFRTADGAALVIFSDNTTLGSGGTVMHVSLDNGTTWTDDWPPNQQYILGIHGTVVELTNGSLLAFGRGNDIDGFMAQSRSDDFGATWHYSASVFPGIHGGQRATHVRLSSGSLLMCSFANTPIWCGEGNFTGLFCALSVSEGDAWELVRGITDNGGGQLMQALDGALWSMDAHTGEPNGYSVARQSPDGMIHLITSRNHYAFNEDWMRAVSPCSLSASPNVELSH